MRNLKKVLSLVLALAMVLSICMVGAGAVNYDDFTDEESITKKQAVETLVSLDVIKGYNDGATFNPTGNVTRAEMATMICRILAGGDNMIVDATKPVPTYADIAAHWAESYIEYCTSLGIVSGKSPSSFDPDAQVTAAEAAKMVMTTLGYNADIEGFKGIGWDINTMAKANTLKLLDNLQGEISASVPVTREQVAQLLYNALVADMVQNYVGTTANVWISSGAERYTQTLLETKFNAEKITGTVVANEFADLYDTEPLGRGKTRLALMDENNDITDKTKVINLSTGRDDLGMSVIVYCDKTTSRVVFGDTQDTNLNKVTEWTAKTDDLTRGDVSVEKGSLTKDTQYFINYDNHVYTVSDYKLKYTVDLKKTGDVDKDYMDALVAANKGEYAEIKDNTGAVVGYNYTKELPRGTELTGTDIHYIEMIFDAADKNGTDVDYYENGAVYVGTQSTKDISDEISYKEFVKKYLGEDENLIVEKNENGNYIKAVDANNDGEIDYVMKTVYAMSVITGIAKNGELTLTDSKTKSEWKIKDADLDCADELAKGDVVVWYLADGIYHMNLAEVVTGVPTDVDYKNDKVTVDGTTYDQSGINVVFVDELVARNSKTDIDLFSQVDNMEEEDVAYNLYFDNYGYVRAWEEALAVKDLVLLTAANTYKGNTTSKTGYAIEGWVDGKIQGFDLNTKGSDVKDYIEDDVVSVTNDWDKLIGVGMTDVEKNHTKDSETPTYWDNGTSSVTNMAAYSISDETMTIRTVPHTSNRETVALYAVDRQDITSKVRELKATETLKDEDGNAVYQNIYTNKSTVYYYVTLNAKGQVKSVKTYTGFNNVPGTMKAEEISAMYAVATLTKMDKNDQSYYTANAVVIESTSDIRGNYDVAMVYNKSTGTLESAFTLDTIANGIDAAGVKTHKNNTDFDNLFIGKESDAAENKYADAFGFYKYYAGDPYADMYKVEKDFGDEKIFAGVVFASNRLDSVKVEKGIPTTAKAGETTNVWLDLEDVKFYTMDLFNRTIDVDAKAVEDLTVADLTGDHIIWVENSRGKVLYAINVTESFVAKGVKEPEFGNAGHYTCNLLTKLWNTIDADARLNRVEEDTNTVAARIKLGEDMVKNPGKYTAAEMEALVEKLTNDLKTGTMTGAERDAAQALVDGAKNGTYATGTLIAAMYQAKAVDAMRAYLKLKGVTTKEAQDAVLAETAVQTALKGITNETTFDAAVQVTGDGATLGDYAGTLTSVIDAAIGTAGTAPAKTAAKKYLADYVAEQTKSVVFTGLTETKDALDTAVQGVETSINNAADAAAVKAIFDCTTVNGKPSYSGSAKSTLDTLIGDIKTKVTAINNFKTLADKYKATLVSGVNADAKAKFDELWAAKVAAVVETADALTASGAAAAINGYLTFTDPTWAGTEQAALAALVTTANDAAAGAGNMAAAQAEVDGFADQIKKALDGKNYDWFKTGGADLTAADIVKNVDALIAGLSFTTVKTENVSALVTTSATVTAGQPRKAITVNVEVTADEANSGDAVTSKTATFTLNVVALVSDPAAKNLAAAAAAVEAMTFDPLMDTEHDSALTEAQVKAYILDAVKEELDGTGVTVKDDAITVTYSAPATANTAADATGISCTLKGGDAEQAVNVTGNLKVVHLMNTTELEAQFDFSSITTAGTWAAVEALIKAVPSTDNDAITGTKLAVASVTQPAGWTDNQNGALTFSFTVSYNGSNATLSGTTGNLA